MILVKDGRVIDPVRGVDDVLDLVLDGGKIAKIGKYQRSEDYERIIEAKGCVVAPGLVDVHVHFRDPGLTYKEDIETGAASAAAGGFTTVVCMANTKPPVDNAETLGYVLDRGAKCAINVLTCATISRGMQGRELVDMEELAACGAAGFTDDGIPLMNEGLVKSAMERAAKLGLPLSFHEEDRAFIESPGVNQGAVSRALGLGGAPALAENVLVARDCMLALHTGARVNIQHISSANSVQLVRLAKEVGARVTAEATPHHFSLTEDAVLEKGPLAKMNPPLRTQADRYAIIEGLKDGAIDIIATDHAPHAAEEKAKPFAEAPSGIIGLETALALGITNLVRKGHLTVMQLMEKMSLNPARLYGLDKGTIAEGADADLVIFNEGERWEVGLEFVSKAANSPFVGEELYGKVKYTICAGRVAYEDRQE
ncbi:dihydroorotase [Senegalimassilia faecalis]|uniref:dihydroorotase n=1 Tax=Senegalimassilia faecalis TaxID=2509433 RepID=UPI00191BEC2B|nr:dihydroorotase [Senegalimassilia faecalis]